MDLCIKCIKDSDLKDFIESQEISSDCDFCDSESINVIDIEDFSQYLYEICCQYYVQAINELPFDSSEGGYMGAITLDTHEMLESLGFTHETDDERLLSEVVERLDSLSSEPVWCSSDWCIPSFDELMLSNWQRFSNVVKHETRFFFAHFQENRYRDPEHMGPMVLLNHIKDLIDEYEIFATLPRGNRLFRARNITENVDINNPLDFGSPPNNLCLQSNRMNPPGISMLYLADSQDLAKMEIRQERAFVGVFELRSDMVFIDLTNLPTVPGFYTLESRGFRESISFLRDFIESITQPISGDNRINIDYIPSQVVTEFLRNSNFENRNICGIRYPSSLSTLHGSNYVIFSKQVENLSFVNASIY